MKKSRAALYGAVGAIVLAAGGVAYAAPDMMKGEMTKAEAQAKADEMFARMDVNGDGKLDDADREARLAKKFAELDKDGNGSISRAEFIAGHGEKGGNRMGHAGGHGPDDKKGGHHGGMRDMMKDKADINNDGAVSAAEFKAAHLAMFEKADANKDGKVTHEERRAAHKAMRDDTQGKHQGH